jgi:predicted nucleic acid-binding protein
MNRVLLDTSAYSAFVRGHVAVREAVAEAEEVFLNPIVLGELRSGFDRGNYRSQNYDLLQQFLSSPRAGIVDITDETAARYAPIRNELRAAGTPLPTNDVWIAASAMEHGLRLLTTDTHYRAIRQVIVDYFDPA